MPANRAALADIQPPSNKVASVVDAASGAPGKKRVSKKAAAKEISVRLLICPYLCQELLINETSGRSEWQLEEYRSRGRGDG